MSNPLFITQDQLELLISSRKVTLEGFFLKISGSKTVYRVVPAARILSCESHVDDPLSLCGKVVPLSALNKKSTVVYLNSITIGSHSYLIDQGYICSIPCGGPPNNNP